MAEVPVLDDVVEFPEEQTEDDRRWIVLYDEDYEDLILDTEDNLGLMLDIEQAGEVIRLASTALADLSHRDADGDDVIQDLIDSLEDVTEEGSE